MVSVKSKFKKSLVLVSLALVVTSCVEKQKTDLLEAEFLTPSEQMQTGCYWYWLDDHITKEGVVKDLQAMKKAGINSAFIGNIGNQGYEYGPAPIFSDAWWEAIHTMFKTAGELNIEIGMFNCPGWSMTGGPWIKPEQAMRYIVSSETRVSGPGQVKIKLPIPPSASYTEDWRERFIDNECKPSPNFQDVRVIVFPVQEDYRVDLLDMSGVKSSIIKEDWKELGENYAPADGRVKPITKTTAQSPIHPRHLIAAGTKYTISYKLPQAQNARGIFIYPAGYLEAQGCLQAKVNGSFITIDSFQIRSNNPQPSIGYAPYSPIANSFNNILSDEFRLIIYNQNKPSAIGKISLYSTTTLDDFAEKTLARMAGCNPAYTEYKWLLQENATMTEGIPGHDQVFDISDKMDKDGTLIWDVPEGEWMVLRTGMVPHEVLNSPSKRDNQGLELDKLSDQHIPYHFDHFIGEILRKIPEEDRPTFKIVVADSWEKGGTLFTDDFMDKMKKRYGYDPMPFLPVYTGHVIGTPDMTERYLWDARRLAADLMSETFVTGFTKVLHENGLQLWSEGYGDWGFPGEFLSFGKHADKTGGEFWTNSMDDRYVRVASSTAHIYNKKQVYAESFTGGLGFKSHPHSLKPFGDMAFAAGMNISNLHVYIHQAYDTIYPGIDAWYGIEFNRKNTWFSQIDLFITYMKRCGVMLQQGLNKADIAYFLGEDVPVNSGPFGLSKQAAKNGISIPELPQGYQYDYVNADVIMNDMQIKDGLFTLPHGTSYKILILPELKTMRPELLQKIKQLVADGGIILGSAPERSPSLQNYPEADRQVQAMADELWGNAPEKKHVYGKGLVLDQMTLAEALQVIELKPDCRMTESVIIENGESGDIYKQTPVDGDYNQFMFNHRIDGNKDIYFLANVKKGIVQVTPEFRVSGKQPELWNPVTGEIRPLLAYEERGDVTAVPLQMESYESMFIVFRKKGKPANFELATNFPQPEELMDLSTLWTVKFNSDKIFRGPQEPVVFETLDDWSQHQDERIHFYSGAAIYTKTFNAPSFAEGEKLYLDLGQVMNMAKIRLNGQYIGGVWTPPYRLDVSEYLKEGANTLEIEVVNTWANRLIGDQFLMKDKRLVESLNNPWRMTSERQESGLRGPVKIVELQEYQK